MLPRAVEPLDQAQDTEKNLVRYKHIRKGGAAVADSTTSGVRPLQLAGLARRTNRANHNYAGFVECEGQLP